MFSGFQVVYTHIGIEQGTLYIYIYIYIYIYALIGNPICLSPCSAGPVCKPSRDIIGLLV